MRRRARALTGLTLLAALVLADGAFAAQTSQNIRIEASDGVSLEATISGEAPLSPRPVVVEFSPYGRGTRSLDPGPAYNFLLVQIRGTGGSDGRFDALGPRTQADVAEVLAWACRQPWSDGNLALNGFSASAITVYNSLHRRLPCVKAAVLKSGTFELYRDLIWPGGIGNLAPAAVVMAGIGGPALAQGFERFGRNPISGPEVAAGLLEAGLSGLQRSTLDDWWRERGFRGDVNDLPILMIDGFFDVESRGAFQAYQELRGDGAQLRVTGAHDGSPAGTDGGLAESRDWLDRFVRGVANGVENRSRVQLWLAEGDREDYLAGQFDRVSAADWPVAGTRWAPLSLDPARSDSATSLNDGSLIRGEPSAAATDSYPALPSLPNATDQPNTATAGAMGLNAFANAFPFVTEMGLAEPLGLSYTTEPFATEVQTAGPASLEVRLSSTAPEAGIWAVLSDVAPDGTAHPVATGRLSNAYPEIDPDRSLRDPETGDVVQPYGAYDRRSPAAPGEERLYRVEFWPIGNSFRPGHRLRLHLLGASALSAPGVPALNSVRVGRGSGARLLLPVLPGSSLVEALP